MMSGFALGWGKMAKSNGQDVSIVEDLASEYLTVASIHA